MLGWKLEKKISRADCKLEKSHKRFAGNCAHLLARGHGHLFDDGSCFDYFGSCLLWPGVSFDCCRRCHLFVSSCDFKLSRRHVSRRSLRGFRNSIQICRASSNKFYENECMASWFGGLGYFVCPGIVLVGLHAEQIIHRCRKRPVLAFRYDHVLNGCRSCVADLLSDSIRGRTCRVFRIHWNHRHRLEILRVEHGLRPLLTRNLAARRKQRISQCNQNERVASRSSDFDVPVRRRIALEFSFLTGHVPLRAFEICGRLSRGSCKGTCFCLEEALPVSVFSQGTLCSAQSLDIVGC